ncbi:MAG: hypothetical protein JKX96_07765 [Acinetobacter sp.]|nr:hypothetical protein [Acinetobacter sp.]
MADNTTLPGTGEIYASDEIGGINFQRVKISVGEAGVAEDLSDANPMPVGIKKNTSEGSATISAGISVGDSTSVIILGANANRKFVAISALGANIFLKLQAASVDDDVKGIFVPAGFTYEFPDGFIELGEISAIAESGTATVYPTEA